MPRAGCRYKVHMYAYGGTSLMLVALGLTFSGFAIFEKHSVFAKVWLAGPSTIAVGLVLAGKVLIDYSSHPGAEREPHYGEDDIDQEIGKLCYHKMEMENDTVVLSNDSLVNDQLIDSCEVTNALTLADSANLQTPDNGLMPYSTSNHCSHHSLSVCPHHNESKDSSVAIHANHVDSNNQFQTTRVHNHPTGFKRPLTSSLSASISTASNSSNAICKSSTVRNMAEITKAKRVEELEEPWIKRSQSCRAPKTVKFPPQSAINVYPNRLHNVNYEREIIVSVESNI